MEELPAAFEAAYQQMMDKAISTSRGERKRRLLENHGHGEKTLLANAWWPAVGHLNYIHPEYEVKDYKDRSRFTDFAYVPPLPIRLALESDGFGPHWRDISRWQFGDDLDRQNHLLIDGWHLLRFSYDDLVAKPRRCQQTVIMGLARWGGSVTKPKAVLNVYERALLQIGYAKSGWLSPQEASSELGICLKTTIKHLQSLADKGLCQASRSPSGRAMRYRFPLPGSE
ncbi:DNA-binding response regulator [Cohnella sp. REN36]|uniref:DNA-binding response regulator n=1 Tax=Cohnella sp. REN36 TaxID=2887347 RepID=UPI001D13AE44|nr:DNA-binding response regulator [Cohnella sp. REN36]MCC3375878.1 DNA-binding response regulator [Cohnella sp. REN36]